METPVEPVGEIWGRGGRRRKGRGAEELVGKGAVRWRTAERGEEGRGEGRGVQTF